MTDTLEKGLGSTLAVLGAAATIASSSPLPMAAKAATATTAPSKWSPAGLHHELLPIAHLESSFGQFMEHAPNAQGSYYTAHGACGLKVVTAHEEWKRYKDIQKLFPGLEEPANFEKEFKVNHKLYNAVASKHWQRIRTAMGSPEKAAYAWRFGLTAARKASDDEIANTNYVKKFKEMLEEKAKVKFNQPIKKAEIVGIPEPISVSFHSDDDVQEAQPRQRLYADGYGPSKPAKNTYTAVLPPGTKIYNFDDDELGLLNLAWADTPHGPMYDPPDFGEIEDKLKEHGYHGHSSYNSSNSFSLFHPIKVQPVVPVPEVIKSLVKAELDLDVLNSRYLYSHEYEQLAGADWSNLIRDRGEEWVSSFVTKFAKAQIDYGNELSSQTVAKNNTIPWELCKPGTFHEAAELMRVLPPEKALKVPLIRDSIEGGLAMDDRIAYAAMNWPGWGVKILERLMDSYKRDGTPLPGWAAHGASAEIRKGTVDAQKVCSIVAELASSKTTNGLAKDFLFQAIASTGKFPDTQRELMERGKTFLPISDIPFDTLAPSNMTRWVQECLSKGAEYATLWNALNHINFVSDLSNPDVLATRELLSSHLMPIVQRKIERLGVDVEGLNYIEVNNLAKPLAMGMFNELAKFSGDATDSARIRAIRSILRKYVNYGERYVKGASFKEIEEIIDELGPDQMMSKPTLWTVFDPQLHLIHFEKSFAYGILKRASPLAVAEAWKHFKGEQFATPVTAQQLEGLIDIDPTVLGSDYLEPDLLTPSVVKKITDIPGDTGVQARAYAAMRLLQHVSALQHVGAEPDSMREHNRPLIAALKNDVDSGAISRNFAESNRYKGAAIAYAMLGNKDDAKSLIDFAKIAGDPTYVSGLVRSFVDKKVRSLDNRGLREVMDFSLSDQYPDNILRGSAIGHWERTIDGLMTAGLPLPEELSGKEFMAKHRWILDGNNTFQKLGARAPDLVHESVVFGMNTNKARKMRDLIQQLSPDNGEVHPNKLPKWGNVLQIGRLPNGNISATKIQQWIDQNSKSKRFNWTTGVWTRSQRHNNTPSAVLHICFTSDHLKRIEEAGLKPLFDKLLNIRSTGHPYSPALLGWVRWTSDKKDAKKDTAARRKGYERPDSIHIEELQSDIAPLDIYRKWKRHYLENAMDHVSAMSDIKMAMSLRRRLRRRGISNLKVGPSEPGDGPEKFSSLVDRNGSIAVPRVPDKDVDSVLKLIRMSPLEFNTEFNNRAQKRFEEVSAGVLEREWPQEKMKKLQEILFGKEHQGVVFHEAFQQWCRNQGWVDVPISCPDLPLKAEISGLHNPGVSIGSKGEWRYDYPGHFKTVYHDYPIDSAWEPATYGDISAQDGEYKDSEATVNEIQQTGVKVSGVLPAPKVGKIKTLLPKSDDRLVDPVSQSQHPTHGLVPKQIPWPTFKGKILKYEEDEYQFLGG
jgi:hypothetical protein